ncbi:outer membrane lipoprotein [Klebsiella variicola]|uniref:Outer membrane lipoprotein n=1 Tax=Klebsiella variicola TaxID=244366 RepID=A0A7H4ME98_KLEVA|nr:outer membrane lipoprotein [Klebsiella variicola]
MSARCWRVAQQESNYQSDPVVPGLNKIAWQEIDRRAEKMHIPPFLVHTALKITSPNGKSYSDRLDNVKTEKQLSAIFDDFIGMVPMGQKLFGSLNPVHTGGPMQVSIAFAEQHTSGYPWKMNGTVRQEVFSLRGGLWFGTYHLLNYPASYSVPLYRFADFNAGWYASRNAAFQKRGGESQRGETGARRRPYPLRQRGTGQHRAGGASSGGPVGNERQRDPQPVEKGRQPGV